jgi:transcriptional regulator with XRE-family HTH domain
MGHRGMSAKQVSGIDTQIANRIYSCRTQLGLSQTDLAVKLGISFQQVQKYEKGANRIGAGRLFQLATIFNVPIEALFPDKEASPSQSDEFKTTAKDLSEILLTVDGRRLFLAFQKIEDRLVRKRVISLIEALVAHGAPPQKAVPEDD